MLDGMQIDSKDRHGAVDTYDIDPRTLLTETVVKPLVSTTGSVNGNRPIIGRLFELINRPVCVVRTLETDEGEIVPVCSNCGEPISLTDSFCPHCSAEVVGNEFDC